jgi:hypothetical protein
LEAETVIDEFPFVFLTDGESGFDCGRKLSFDITDGA